MCGYLRSLKKRDAQAREAAEKGKLFSEGPKAQHPHIDTNHCIGCATCTIVCPEGDVLAMIAGKAVIVNGYKCIGHGLCAEACPVGAITMVMASPSMGADMPYLTPEYETTIPSLFIVGELGGLALIKNAVNQGRDCVDTIATQARQTAMASRSAPKGCLRRAHRRRRPAGISASLRAIEHKLKLRHPRTRRNRRHGSQISSAKAGDDQPGRISHVRQIQEDAAFQRESACFLGHGAQPRRFQCLTGEKVEDIKKGEDGIFTVLRPTTIPRVAPSSWRWARAGEPRKLGVKAKNYPK